LNETGDLVRQEEKTRLSRGGIRDNRKRKGRGETKPGGEQFLQNRRKQASRLKETEKGTGGRKMATRILPPSQQTLYEGTRGPGENEGGEILWVETIMEVEYSKKRRKYGKKGRMDFKNRKSKGKNHWRTIIPPQSCNKLKVLA